MMKIDVVSKEILKPSPSSVPNHLRSSSYKFCLLDQLAPHFYVPIVLFYSSRHSTNNETKDKVKKLKQCLSEVLVEFSPLAGKIRNDVSVEPLEGDGVSFIEARANAKLSEILENPKMSSIQQLLPINPYNVKKDYDDEGVPVLVVQLNVFDCGGIGIGICISHKVADGTTLSTFLTAWAASVGASSSSHGHESGKRIPPSFDSAVVFPPREIQVQPPSNLIMKAGRVATKRFLFDSSSLEKLKAKAMGTTSDNFNPTRVEVVTALISKTALKSRNKISSNEKISKPSMVISQVVNLRGRMDPPLPETTIGNIWRSAVATIMEEEGEESKKLELHDFVVQLKKAIRKINKDYVAKIRTEDGYMLAYDSLKEASKLVSEGVAPFYRFSSWLRFPLYETDLGWGKPIWACVTNIPIKDVVILMSNSSGDGVEAWINLEEEDMARFEKDPEFLQFASQAPGS
ncbi:stemmadenine O-acetyltransferase-like [Humulus lupulus]|uniref:stemmadenine O-acetyltransferase-like n=1 Tax=Humulus lupulus TaxID=3486 RepID=UPI002B417FDA|nr:stemmadenine O-acetyltransferase-like [Humulus lupulus]